MFKMLLFIILIIATHSAYTQASDFIVIKKHNNRTIKTFFPGLPISFYTTYKKQVNGIISSIRNDSVFIKQWDLMQVITKVGEIKLDTTNLYVEGFHYKEIEKVDVSDKIKFEAITLSSVLTVGGIGYAALNIFNGLYLKQSITDAENIKKLGIATGAVGLGVLVNFIRKKRRKYIVEYIRMNETKKQLRDF